MNGPTTDLAVTRQPRRRWRTWWLRQLYSWHWISAAVSLVALLLFAITGLTLNHAGSITAAPVVSARRAILPPKLRPALAHPAARDAPLPAAVARRIKEATGLDPGGQAGEWSAGEVYVALPRPGGDGWVSIDRTTGAIASETTDRGWISYFNDLHKGRNTGAAWFWFIDLFAGACIVFAVTGVLLLQFHAGRRPLTWPLVAAGFLLPAIIAVVFIH